MIMLCIREKKYIYLKKKENKKHFYPSFWRNNKTCLARFLYLPSFTQIYFLSNTFILLFKQGGWRIVSETNIYTA